MKVLTLCLLTFTIVPWAGEILGTLSSPSQLSEQQFNNLYFGRVPSHQSWSVK